MDVSNIKRLNELGIVFNQQTALFLLMQNGIICMVPSATYVDKLLCIYGAFILRRTIIYGAFK